MGVRTKGKIVSWNDAKGFGFVAPLSGGKQVFIHMSAFANRGRRPEIDEVVTYSLSKDSQGRPCAANATLVGDKLTKRAPRRSNGALISIALLFLAAVGGMALTSRLPGIVMIVYAFASLIAFAAYAIDKSAARRGQWRTSEGTLLLIGLAGGWPGALVAQELLRHKSSKTSFRFAFWVTVLANLAVLAWLTTRDGRLFVQNLVN